MKTASAKDIAWINVVIHSEYVPSLHWWISLDKLVRLLVCVCDYPWTLPSSQSVSSCSAPHPCLIFNILQHILNLCLLICCVGTEKHQFAFKDQAQNGEAIGWVIMKHKERRERKFQMMIWLKLCCFFLMLCTELLLCSHVYICVF